MNNKFYLIAMGAALSLGAYAAPLTPQQALERARSSSPARVSAKIASTAKPAFTQKTDAGNPAAYIFKAAEGYVILSGDDVAYPVLGYSDSGSFDETKMSPEMKWWLSEYARQIQWANENGISAAKAPQANADWTAIAPLVKTKWDQGAPYNDQCPKVRSTGKSTYTGCVATSMAQVMNYHKYPEAGEGSINYYNSNTDRTLILNLAQKKFDWDNMLDIYNSGEYTKEQADAVAYLMKACGYSVQMNYGTEASGAQGSEIASALVKYFNYDSNCRALERLIYSSSQWAEMIYDNLKNVGPIVINGRPPEDAGHSFVCDGYDGKGYFHFNWGWGGVSDGYYSLDALNPEAQGTGGSVGGFNFHQNAIFGAQRPTGQPTQATPPALLQYGNSTGSISGKVLTLDVKDYNPLGWGGYYDSPVLVNIGVAIESIDNPSTPVQYVKGKLGNFNEVSMSTSYSYYPNDKVKPEVTLPTLADGKYKVTLSTCNAGKSDWMPIYVPWGYINYVMLTVEGGKYTVSDVPMQNILISDLKVIGDLYNTKNTLMSAHLKNASDIELTQGVCPRLLDANGKQVFTGESALISLMPGEEKDFEWTAKFFAMSGAPAINDDTEFDLILVNPISGEVYPGVSVKVIMHKTPASASLMVTTASIEGAAKGTLNYLDKDYLNTNFISSGTSFVYDYTLKVRSGYADGLTTVSIMTPDPAHPTTLIPVEDQIFSAYTFIPRNEEKEYSVSVDFPEGEAGKIYYLVVYYASLGRTKLIQTPFTFGVSGIDEITDADNAPAEYFDLQGMKIERPVKGQVVIVRKGSKVSKQIYR